MLAGHRFRSGVEGRAELLAQARHGGNGRNRDQRGDEAIFDGRRAIFVAKELIDELHEVVPLSCEQHPFF